MNLFRYHPYEQTILTYNEVVNLTQNLRSLQIEPDVAVLQTYGRLKTTALLPHLHPNRRMIARLLPPTHKLIHSRTLKLRKRGPVQQKMIDPQPGVAAPGVAEVIPERVDALFGV